jgi:hypothetical protein
VWELVPEACKQPNYKDVSQVMGMGDSLLLGHKAGTSFENEDHLSPLHGNTIKWDYSSKFPMIIELPCTPTYPLVSLRDAVPVRSHWEAIPKLLRLVASAEELLDVTGACWNGQKCCCSSHLRHSGSRWAGDEDLLPERPSANVI